MQPATSRGMHYGWVQLTHAGLCAFTAPLLDDRLAPAGLCHVCLWKA